ncbi:MAG: DivIVA domain-containing protein [Eubacteriales bacterium]|nr:DivIVA domain-containing protein [Eubacteriales bacterium]
MTVQEIQEIGFEKAVFGGYDMKSVDTFLERVAEEFATMQKENAALKAKMKVVVEKVEEYRGRESNMGRVLNIAEETLDRAKQEADGMIAAAKKEAEGILATAKSEAADRLKTTQAEIDAETAKLETARKTTIEFIARVSSVYQAQAKALVELAKAEKLVHQSEPTGQPAAAPQQVAQPTAQAPATPQQDEPAEAAPAQADAPVEDATRKFDFGELKFGADYDPKQ